MEMKSKYLLILSVLGGGVVGGEGGGGGDLNIGSNSLYIIITIGGSLLVILSIIILLLLIVCLCKYRQNRQTMNSLKRSSTTRSSNTSDFIFNSPYEWTCRQTRLLDHLRPDTTGYQSHWSLTRDISRKRPTLQRRESQKKKEEEKEEKDEDKERSVSSQEKQSDHNPQTNSAIHARSKSREDLENGETTVDITISSVRVPIEVHEPREITTRHIEGLRHTKPIHDCRVTSNSLMPSSRKAVWGGSGTNSTSSTDGAVDMYCNPLYVRRKKEKEEEVGDRGMEEEKGEEVRVKQTQEQEEQEQQQVEKEEDEKKEEEEEGVEEQKGAGEAEEEEKEKEEEEIQEKEEKEEEKEEAEEKDGGNTDIELIRHPEQNGGRLSEEEDSLHYNNRAEKNTLNLPQLEPLSSILLSDNETYDSGNGSAVSADISTLPRTTGQQSGNKRAPFVSTNNSKHGPLREAHTSLEDSLQQRKVTQDGTEATGPATHSLETIPSSQIAATSNSEYLVYEEETTENATLYASVGSECISSSYKVTGQHVSGSTQQDNQAELVVTESGQEREIVANNSFEYSLTTSQ